MTLEQQFGFTPEFLGEMEKQDERLAKLREELNRNSQDEKQ